jgi:hypothetical protein
MPVFLLDEVQIYKYANPDISPLNRLTWTVSPLTDAMREYLVLASISSPRLAPTRSMRRGRRTNASTKLAPEHGGIINTLNMGSFEHGRPQA